MTGGAVQLLSNHTSVQRRACAFVRGIGRRKLCAALTASTPLADVVVSANGNSCLRRRFMAEAWKFRHNTLDRAIFNGVVLFNEYQLPARFAPEDIVIDVGAHIGSFAYE